MKGQCMSNEIDRLMTLDPLDLTRDDIDKLVAYQRRMRQMYEAGVKPEKQQLDQVKGSALLEKLKLKAPPKPLDDRRG
jgi:hypothetical protein